MKLPTFLLLTHGTATAAVAAATVALCQTHTPLNLASVAALAGIAAGLAAWRAARPIRAAVLLLETVVADHEKSATTHAGLTEFNRVLQTLGRSAAQWETAAATSRRQNRELQAMLGLLGGTATGTPTCGQLRELLADLGNAFQTQHDKLTRTAADIVSDAETITAAAEPQQRAFADALSRCDQLITAIASLDQQVSSTTASGQQSCELSDRLNELHQQIQLLALNASLQIFRHSECLGSSPQQVPEPQASAVELQAAINDLVAMLQATDRELAEMSGNQSQRSGARDPDRETALPHLLASLRQTLDEHSLCVRRLNETIRDQHRRASQLRAALERCSAMAQLQQERVAQLGVRLRAHATHPPFLERQIDRLLSCRPGAVGPMSRPPVLASAERSIRPSDSDLFAAGGIR